MNKKEKQQIRLKVWQKLKDIALPDSRFHLNFEEYIPDFKNSINARDQIVNSEEYKKSKLLFITPDNCLTTTREQAIKDGADYEELVEISPGYGLAFQDMGEGQPWNAGTSMGTHDFVENVRRSSWDLADFRVPSTAPEVDAPADRSEVGGEFDRAASPVDPAEPVSRLDEFQATREEIVSPVVPDAAAGAGDIAPVVQPNTGAR